MTSPARFVSDPALAPGLHWRPSHLPGFTLYQLVAPGGVLIQETHIPDDLIDDETLAVFASEYVRHLEVRAEAQRHPRLRLVRNGRPPEGHLSLPLPPDVALVQ